MGPASALFGAHRVHFALLGFWCPGGAPPACLICDVIGRRVAQHPPRALVIGSDRISSGATTFCYATPRALFPIALTVAVASCWQWTARPSREKSFLDSFSQPGRVKDMFELSYYSLYSKFIPRILESQIFLSLTKFI